MFWQQWFNLNTSSYHAFWQSLIIGLWFNVAAGFIYAIILYLAVFKKMYVCEGKWCFRIGHHRVKGTHYKTCPKHTTDKDHKILIAKHKRKHPEAHKFLNQDKKLNNKRKHSNI